MTKKLTVGVLFGGRSTEHHVSLVSAQSVIDALDREKYEVVPIGITLQGRWICGERALEQLKAGIEPEEGFCFLPPDPTVKRLLATADATPLSEKIDVIFPVLHGSYGEDGTLQGLLELADIPYVGAGVLGSAAAMDKIVQKILCRQAGLPVVDFLWFRSEDWQRPRPIQAAAFQISSASQDEIVDAVESRLGYPVFVKPPNLGSSIGISKAKDRRSLIEAIELACRYDRKVLVEAAVPNAREIEVAVLGNEEPRAAIPGEVIPSNEFYDYDAKYVDGASKIVIPAPLPAGLTSDLREAAVRSVIAAEVEGMARVDFLLNSETNRFYLNEINTIPGFTSISMYPKMWEASGLPYPALLDELIRLALDRAQKRRALSTTYRPSREWYR